MSTPGPGAVAPAGRPGQPQLLVAPSKNGTVYVINTDDMGEFDPTTDNVVQELQNVVSPAFDSPAFFNNTLYTVSEGDAAKTFSFNGTELSPQPTSRSSEVYGYPGSTPSISANGSSDGIVWDLDPTMGQLIAYDASSYGDELYSSDQAPDGRDALDSVVKFTTPTAADGYVYVGTSDELVGFGLEPPSIPGPAQPSNLVATVTAPGQINLTWTDNAADEDGFQIEQLSAKGTSFTPIGTTAAGTDSFVVSGLTPTQTYSFRVGAYNSDGPSAYTLTTSATPTPSTLPFDFLAPWDADDSTASSSPLQPGYMGVSQNQTFALTGLFGWQSAVSSFNRDANSLQAAAPGVPDFRDLLQAGDYGFGRGTFEAALAPGSYVVTLTVGDAQGSVSGMTATANGTPVTFTLGDGSSTSTLSAPFSQFLTASFPVTIDSSGLLNLTFQGAGGTGVWMVNGLTIRQEQAPLTLSVSSPALDSNGIAAVTVSGSGATPNSLVTVGSSLGTVTAADQEGNYAGTQVLADANGNFTYTVETPAAGQATFSAQEVTGASFGQTTVSISPPPRALPLALDFLASYNVSQPGQTSSPLQAGYVSLTAKQTFDGSYGWQSAVNSFNRNVSLLQAPATGVPDFRSLLQAGQYGFGSGTFEATLAPGSYVATLTVGDAQGNPSGMTATANGTPVTFTLGDGSSTSTLSAPFSQFLTASFPVSVSSSGLLSLTVQGAGGTGVWIVNGLTIRQAQAPLTLSVSTPALDSNGIAAVTVSGSGATPNSLVTVGSSLGTVTANDQEGNYAGTQVLADASGNFTYTVETPAAGPTTFSARK